MPDHYTPQSLPRMVTIGKIDYLVRVQGYKFLAPAPESNFILKTFIEVVTGKEPPQLLGSLYTLENPAHPDLKDIPVFTRIDANAYHSQRAIYLGDDGFKQAVEDLAKISNYALAQGINHYIVNHIEETILILLRMYDSVNQRWFTVNQVDLTRSDLQGGKPPLTYRWDNVLFEQSAVVNDGGISHIVYVPSQIKLRAV